MSSLFHILALIGLAFHVVVVQLLARTIPQTAPEFESLFGTSIPWFFTPTIGYTQLKYRFLVPWINTPDLSAFGRSAPRLLLLSRVSSSVALILIFVLIVFSIFAPAIT